MIVVDKTTIKYKRQLFSCRLYFIVLKQGEELQVLLLL
ncbi:hypothetical protein FLA_4989 [Filimonas lacunae]|nr:hypothetical protein FLA_4989 [Filimonas lacunae]